MRFDQEIFGVFLYLFITVVVGAAIVGIMKGLTYLLKTGVKKRGKYETYECGVPLLGSSRERFSVKFYLVALLFVLFDIETVFLLPYAVAYRRLGMDGFIGVLAFVAVLGIGLLYVVKRRALEWD
jgi:NADH-quinone oxidoreductase subunit A